MVTLRDHPISDINMATSFPEFVSILSAKMRFGAEEHGDRSFSRTGVELVKELINETVDLAGWGYILWLRLRDLEQKLKDVEARCEGQSSQ